MTGGEVFPEKIPSSFYELEFLREALYPFRYVIVAKNTTIIRISRDRVLTRFLINIIAVTQLVPASFPLERMVCRKNGTVN